MASTDPWWAVPKLVPTGRGDQQQFVPEQAATRPANAIGGPFATEQECEQWIIRHNAAPPPIPTIPNPLGFLGEIGHWVGLFVAAVTDIHTWISLSWLTLGLILLVMGIIWWNRGTITRLAATAAAA